MTKQSICQKFSTYNFAHVRNKICTRLLILMQKTEMAQNGD